MSRIEQALEKAALLRENAAGRLGIPVAEPQEERPVTHTVPPPFVAEIPAEVTIDNPLLATLSDPHSYISEEYRKLKSAIVAKAKESGFRNAIMVTSTLDGEGKSITALNLAITLAQEYDHTVLLIDADLRKPMVGNYLGIPVARGLADYLADNAELSDILVKTGIGRLTLLPAGNPVANPVELLSSQRMKALLDEVKHRYPDRFVIIDAPPALPFAEVRALALLVDGIVFVVREGQSSLASIDEAIGALNKHKVLGLVYNDASAAGLGTRYRYGYRYQGYRGPEESSGAENDEPAASGKPEKRRWIFGARKARGTAPE